MEFLVLLENSALAAWARESGSLLAYPMILTVHVAGMSLLAGASAALGIRILGFAPSIPLGPFMKLFRVIWVGFALNASSGVILFMADATTKAAQTTFRLKLALIALGVVNCVLLQASLASSPGRGETGATSVSSRLLAATSLAIWAGAIAAGRLMAYI